MIDIQGIKEALPHRYPMLLVDRVLAGVLELSKPENKGKLVFYAGMDKVKFKKQVVPGDQLVMTATFVKRRGTIAVVEAKAEVDGKLAASGTLTFAIGN